MSLDRPTFRTVRLRESYSADQVDLAVEMVLENLALPVPRIDRDHVEGLLFTPVRGGGYVMSDVDAWFDEAAAELDRRTGVVPAVVEAPVPEAPVETPTPATAITEVDAESQWTSWAAIVGLLLVVAALVYWSFA